jgi:hypothetical protein
VVRDVFQGDDPDVRGCHSQQMVVTADTARKCQIMDWFTDSVYNFHQEPFSGIFAGRLVNKDSAQWDRTDRIDCWKRTARQSGRGIDIRQDVL